MNGIKRILMILSFVLFMLVSNSVGLAPTASVAKADDGEQTADVLTERDQDKENAEGTEAEAVQQEIVAENAGSEEPAASEAEEEQLKIAAEGAEGEGAKVPEEKVAAEKEAVRENPVAADELNALVLLAADPDGEDGEITIKAEGDGVDVYDPVKIIIPFTKEWDDANNQDGKRPDSITVKLYRYKGDSYAETDLFKTAEVTASNNWTYNFELANTLDDEENAAFYEEDGTYHVYKFAVKEDPVPYYEETVHEDPEVKMVVESGEDNWIWITPNSTLEFPVYTDTYPKSFIAAKKGNHLYIWTPEKLSPIEQAIVLEAVSEHPQFPTDQGVEGTTYLTGFGHHEAGFTMNAGDPGSIKFDSHPSWSFWARGSYSRSTPEENAGSITNKLETATVTVTKSWADSSDQDGIRPDTLELTLNGLPEGTTAPTPTIAKSEDGNSWMYTWAGLPKTLNGEDIAYTVTEKEVPRGYTCGTTTVAAGETITNTHVPSKTEISVTKKWDDANNQDGKRPDELTLTLNGLPEGTDAPTPTITKSEDGNTWTYTWSNVPVYAAGEQIAYTVTEESVPEGYTCETTTVNAGGILVNKHVPETIDLKIVKVWEDSDNKDGMRPQTLNVTLSNGNKVTLSESNQWTAVAEGLPKYEKGKEITYTWKEDSMPEGYKLLSQEVTGLITTITNQYTPKTIDITVKKVWNDVNDKDKLRPANVTVHILANGKEVESFELSEENKWTATLEAQPAKKDGKDIVYTVTEDAVASYTTAISGSAKDGFTVTNSHTPPTPPTPPKPPVPNTAGK